LVKRSLQGAPMMPEGEPAGPSECSRSLPTAVFVFSALPMMPEGPAGSPSGIIGAPCKERFTKLVNDLHVLY